MFFSNTKAEAGYTGWKQVGKDYYYYVNDYLKKGSDDSLNYIDGEYYALDSATGKRLTGWVAKGSNWYWCHPSTGHPITGWKNFGKEWYYFSARSYGTYRMLKGEQTINGKTFFFDEKSGLMKTGWQPYYSFWKYFDPKTGVMKTGWQKIGKYWYYLNNYGNMQTGTQTIDGKSFYFGVKGEMKTGWQTPYGNRWYYYHPTYGYKMTGWQKIGGKWYYLNNSGTMVQDGKYKIDGETYFFDTNGVMKTGWVGYLSNWYYFNSNGTMKTGWLQLGSNWYYLEPVSGSMYRGGYHYIGGTRYWFYNDGRLY